MEILDQMINIIYPQLINPLRKYLRFTKQFHNYSYESFKSHLKTCLQYHISAKAYLSQYFNPTVALFTKHLTSSSSSSFPTSTSHHPMNSSSNRSSSLVYQTWKLKHPGWNFFKSIHDGLIFELSRSNAKFLCQIKSNMIVRFDSQGLAKWTVDGKFLHCSLNKNGDHDNHHFETHLKQN